MDLRCAMLVTLFAVVAGRDLVEPKFRVLTPDELMVEVPHYEDMELVTFRIGVRRKDNGLEDLELGENVMNNNRIFIYNERLDLKRDDVVNYLLAFKDKEGYQAQTGRYVFDGVYFKKPFGRRHRYRRDAITTTEAPGPDTEETPSIESRFGHHHHGHPHGGQWPGNNGGFNPFRPPGRGPGGLGPPGHWPPNYPNRPNYPRPDCDDHRHDMCHETEPERWEKSTKKPAIHEVEYHCRMCQKVQVGRQKMSTSTEFPDIDIRFSDD